jgi:hypothetical protein
MAASKKKPALTQSSIRALVKRLVDEGHVNLARAWAKRLEQPLTR